MKKVPHAAPDGTTVSPKEPNALKFEARSETLISSHNNTPLCAFEHDPRVRKSNTTAPPQAFVFDVYPFAERPLLLEGKREEDFAPVKNAEGAGRDSPVRFIFLLWISFACVCLAPGAECLDLPAGLGAGARGCNSLPTLPAHPLPRTPRAPWWVRSTAAGCRRLAGPWRGKGSLRRARLPPATALALFQSLSNAVWCRGLRDSAARPCRFLAPAREWPFSDPAECVSPLKPAVLSVFNQQWRRSSCYLFCFFFPCPVVSLSQVSPLLSYAGEGLEGRCGGKTVKAPCELR